MPRQPLQQALWANADRMCAVPGCPQRRAGLAKHCDSHDKRNESAGHPLGTVHRAGFWRPYVKVVERLFAANAGHPSIVALIATLDRELQAASASDSRSPFAAYSRLLARIRDGGRTGRTLAVRLVAAAAAYDQEPQAFASERNHDFNVAALIVALRPSAPVRERFNVGTRTYISERMRSLGGPLISHIARHTRPITTTT